MASDSLAMLRRPFATAWALARHHLDGLTTNECLWRPAARGPHVRQGEDGRWHADWPDHEGYDLGPPSIAWTSWHILFWWSMALDHNFGAATLAREDVAWPGDAARARAAIGELQARWQSALERLDPDAPSRWPFTDRTMADVVGWATVELTKNAAEIGYARFLYAVRAA
jgi:hypothetical protein